MKTFIAAALAIATASGAETLSELFLEKQNTFHEDGTL